MTDQQQQRQPQPSPSSHVRPKVRHGKKVASNTAVLPKEEDLDALLEQTRRQVDSWLTISPPAATSTNGKSEPIVCKSDISVVTKQPISSSNDDISKPQQQQQPKGILRKPKYSSAKTATICSTSTTRKHESVHTDKGNEESVLMKSDTIRQNQLPFVKDFVVEREVPRRAPITPVSSDSIEGYTPKIDSRQIDKSRVQQTTENISHLDTSKEEEDSTEPLILSSMSELLAHAGSTGTGTLPNGASPQVLETDLEFSCMAPEQYQEAVQEEQSNIHRAFYGRQDIFEENSDTEEDDETMSVDEPNDDALLYELEMLMENDEDYEENYYVDGGSNDALPPPEPRAFMRLWTALSDWVTPEAVQLVKQWHFGGEQPQIHQVDRSDVGASRCAGLQSILKMHIGSVQFNDAQQQRNVEAKLAELTRAFDYSQPNPKLGTKLWRTMTTVLVHIAMANNNNGDATELPECAQDVGMTSQEYVYLCQSALTSFSAKVEPGE